MQRDEHVNARDLAIIEKYEATVNYLYPILQSFPRRHGELRDRMIGLVFDMVGLLKSMDLPPANSGRLGTSIKSTGATAIRQKGESE